MPVVMEADRITRALTRISHEVVERNRGIDQLALVGIRTRGVPLARRLAKSLLDIVGQEVPTGTLDITLYRDDLMRHPVGPQPVVRRTDILFSIDDKKILLVDDVLYSGRTVRAALDALARAYPQVAPYVDHTMAAVNQEYADHSRALEDGDELAVIPPVSGGQAGLAQPHVGSEGIPSWTTAGG